MKMKHKKNNELNQNKGMMVSAKRVMIIYSAIVIAFVAGACHVMAAGDPIQTVNNLSNFIFSLIRAIGLILLGLGIMQVGLSFKSHDPSQRSNGFLTLAGGIIIVFTKEILNMIVG